MVLFSCSIFNCSTVSPSPTHGTPSHLHFSQGMLSTGCSPSWIYTAITRRSDSFDGGFEILLPTRASPFCGFTRSQLPPCPKGSPGGGQPVLNPADGPLPPPTCQLGSSLLPCLLLASFCLPHHQQSQGATGGCQHVLAGNYQQFTANAKAEVLGSVASQKLHWIWKSWDHGVQRLHLRENHPLRVSV